MSADIDLDLADREQLLKLIHATPARQITQGQVRKHKFTSSQSLSVIFVHSWKSSVILGHSRPLSAIVGHSLWFSASEAKFKPCLTV